MQTAEKERETASSSGGPTAIDERATASLSGEATVSLSGGEQVAGQVLGFLDLFLLLFLRFSVSVVFLLFFSGLLPSCFVDLLPSCFWLCFGEPMLFVCVGLVAFINWCL